MAIEFPPINRGVPLLNKLLGLKTADSPHSLSQLVQPTTELLPWWATGIESIVKGSQTIGVGVTGILTPAAMVVPATARWLVMAVTLRATVGVNQNFTMGGAYTLPGAVVESFALGPRDTNAIDGNFVLFECQLPAYWPLILPPGGALGIFVRLNTGTAAAAVEIAARIAQFEA